MFRGTYPARIDEKSRLKIPKDFRTLIEQHHGREVFVTSTDGTHVRIYPMPVWLELEKKLGGTSPIRPAEAERFFEVTNYYGQTSEVDNQGRVLIHQKLRETADMTGEVDVQGTYDHLRVWNHDRMAAKIAQEPFTAADLNALFQQLARG